MGASIGPTYFSNRNVHTLWRARPHRSLPLDGWTGSEPTCRLRCALAAGIANAIASASTLRLRSAGSESGTPRRQHHRSGDQCRGYGREARAAVEGARSHAQESRQTVASAASDQCNAAPRRDGPRTQVGVQFAEMPVRGPDDFAPALKTLRGTDGVLNLDNPLFVTYRAQLVDAVAGSRLLQGAAQAPPLLPNC